jgi:hypothetical protein
MGSNIPNSRTEYKDDRKKELKKLSQEEKNQAILSVKAIFFAQQVQELPSIVIQTSSLRY